MPIKTHAEEITTQSWFLSLKPTTTTVGELIVALQRLPEYANFTGTEEMNDFDGKPFIELQFQVDVDGRALSPEEIGT
jgi:hypothetical protein